MMHRKMDWNKASDIGTSFHGWRLDGVLLNLLRPAGTPELTSWPQERKHDWNAHFDDKEVGPKLRELLQQAQDATCEQCHLGGDCIHNAARTIEGLRLAVEHPPDCPECKRIHEQQDSEWLREPE